MIIVGRVLARVLLASALVVGTMGAVRAAGALAVGACGAHGYSYDFSRAEAARKAALAKCAGNCKAVPMRKACAALAIDVRNPCGAHGYASAPQLGQAQNSALHLCHQFGGRDCVIRAWVCDRAGEAPTEFSQPLPPVPSAG
jgi:hypothetical protein